MEDLTKLTPTELLVKGNQLKAKHDTLKDEINAEMIELKKLDESINRKILKLQELEIEYVGIVEIITE